MRVLAQPSLAEIAVSIDWSPFFASWELIGRYPQILEDDVVGKAATDLIDWTPDENIRRIVKSWPGRVESARARALGLSSDPDFETIIRDYIRENPQAIKIALPKG